MLGPPKRFQIIDNAHSLEVHRFCKIQLGSYIVVAEMMLSMEMKMKMVNDNAGAWGQCLKHVFIVLGVI